MLRSVSGVQLDTCNGYDSVAHKAMPNQKVGCSWKLKLAAPGFELTGGSLGSQSWYRIWLPDPGCFE